jgi:voltage-gated potassium channel
VAGVTARQRIYAVLDPENQSATSRHIRAFEVAVILTGIASVSLGTMGSLGDTLRAVAAACTGVVATLFLVEYLVRLWIAPETPHISTTSALKARWRWAVSAEGLIDLLAIMPAIATVSGGARLGAESAAVFVLLWVFKLGTYAPGVSLIARVAYNERRAIGAVSVLFVITLMSAATLAHFAEEAVQPDAFGSIPAAMWWAMVTLTTAGYGDVVPQTLLGRLIAGAVMISGIAVLALMAGILATGFAEEMKRREFVRTWELVAKVPFFADVGAVAISEIVARLRSRNYHAGTVVVRRDTPGDAMFFIVSGEVEVRVGARPVVLRDGAFFGEMALLDRRPRSADVVTVTACTLLVLNVADFYQIAGHQPALIAAIEAEARRRQAANRAAQPG